MGSPNFRFRRTLVVDGYKITVKNQRFHILEGCDRMCLSGRYLLGYKGCKLVYKQMYSANDEWDRLNKLAKKVERNNAQ